MKKKKILALAMALAMAATPVSALAEEAVDLTTTPGGATIEGAGDIEGYLSTDVYSIILPTVADVNFTVDPQGLLGYLDGETYALGEGAVYFANASGDFTGTSDEIIVTNKSSFAVDVNVEVAVTTTETGVTLVEEANLAEAEVPSLYLGLITDDGEAEAITEASFEADTAELAAIPAAEFDEDGTLTTAGYGIAVTTDATVAAKPNGAASKTDPTKFYLFDIIEDTTPEGTENDVVLDPETFGSVSYKLTAKCDATADWSEVDTTNLKCAIVWSCNKHGVVVDDDTNSDPATPGDPATPSEPTEAYGFWYNNNGTFNCWLGLDAETGFEGELSNFKVNGVACEAEMAENGWISVAYTDMVSAGATNEQNTYEITFTVGEVDYIVVDPTAAS